MTKENDDDLDPDRNHVETTTQLQKILGVPMIDPGIMETGVKAYVSLTHCHIAIYIVLFG